MDKIQHTDGISNMNKTFDIKNPLSTPIRPPLTRQNAIKHFNDLEIGESSNVEQSIEMRTITCSFSPEQNNSDSPESTASTVSQTTSLGSSEDELVPTALFSEVKETISESALIGKRIVKNYELRMMASLPENNQTNRDYFRRISMMTPDGLYQFNEEIQQIKCILNASELEKVTVIFKNAHLIDEPMGVSVYDELTLRQLNKLEAEVRSHGGFTVIGYSINEEVFLKLMGLGFYQYPPEPDAYPSEILKLINKPLSRDISISLRSMVQSYIVFNYLMRSYFEFNNQSDDAYYELSIENTKWFLLALSSMLAVNLLLLRGGFTDKERVSAIINRSVLIESSMIGAAQNWMTYPALFLPPLWIEYGFIPALAYGSYCGRFDNNELFTLPVINISNQTKINTISTGLSYALTAGSLWSLGLIYPINDLFFLNKNISDPKVYNEFEQALMIAQYSVLAITLMAQMARYPHNDRKCQAFGRYSSNVINGLSYTWLDSAAASVFVGMLTTLIFGNNPPAGNKNFLAMSFTLLAFIQIYTFMTTFATTKDLPEYSIEPVPPQDSIYTKMKNFFNLKINGRQSREVTNIDPEADNPAQTYDHRTSMNVSLFFSKASTNEMEKNNQNVESPIHSKV